MDPFTIWIISAGVGALIAIFTVIALRITAWLVKVAIKGIIGLIKKIKARSAVVRKRDKLVKFIKLARESDNHEVADELDNIRKNHKAILTPLDKNGEEEWAKLKVIAADSDEDDLADGFMVADTGRVGVI